MLSQLTNINCMIVCCCNAHNRLFIGFQWTLIMVQFIVADACPDVPEEVDIQLQRQAFIRSKILDKVSCVCYVQLCCGVVLAFPRLVV